MADYAFNALLIRLMAAEERQQTLMRQNIIIGIIIGLLVIIAALLFSKNSSTNASIEKDINESKDNLKIKSGTLSFVGERSIKNDKYKLFLVDRYQITKNDVLNKYVCDDKLFTTVDEALAHAALIEDAKLKKNELKDDSKIKSGIQSFVGDKSIKNDKYKLFLVAEYQIKKNDTLNQYVCNDILFSSFDEALAHAALIEEAKLKKNEVQELLRKLK